MTDRKNILQRIGGLLQSPEARGVAGAAAIGFNPLLGLLAAPALRNSRERKELENDALREEINTRRDANSARRQLQKLIGSTRQAADRQVALPGVEGDSFNVNIPGRRGVPALNTQSGRDEALALLQSASPNAGAQGVLSQIVPQAGRQTTLQQNLRILTDPSFTDEQKQIARDQLTKTGGNDPLAQAIQALVLRDKQFAVSEREREAAAAEEEGQQKAVQQRNVVNDSLTQIDQLLQLNEELRGTELATGRVAPDLRKTGARLSAEFLPGQNTDLEGLVAKRDLLEKGFTDFGVETIAKLSSEGLGFSNAFRQSIQESLPNADIDPAANQKILLDNLRNTIREAEQQGIEIEGGIERWKKLLEQYEDSSQRPQITPEQAREELRRRGKL